MILKDLFLPWNECIKGYNDLCGREKAICSAKGNSSSPVPTSVPEQRHCTARDCKERTGIISHVKQPSEFLKISSMVSVGEGRRQLMGEGVSVLGTNNNKFGIKYTSTYRQHDGYLLLRIYPVCYCISITSCKQMSVLYLFICSLSKMATSLWNEIFEHVHLFPVASGQKNQFSTEIISNSLEQHALMHTLSEHRRTQQLHCGYVLLSICCHSWCQ